MFSLPRPEILKQEIKVFFVKYNDPIYVKLEKLDIMIRLASQANIAQVCHAVQGLPYNMCLWGGEKRHCRSGFYKSLYKFCNYF